MEASNAANSPRKHRQRTTALGTHRFEPGLHIVDALLWLDP